MRDYHILVAIDLSRRATSCIPSVADLAGLVGGRVTLFHVVESLEAIPHGSPLAPPLEPPQNVRAIEAARTELEKCRAAFGSDIPVDIELVSGGDAAERITAYSNANDVDLIAMTTHGRTGVKRLVLGSVAEAVIRRSRVPVLVLPLPKD